MGKNFIVTGMGFGDEGKGTVVDFLVRESINRGSKPLVVRHNGGAQAAHNVVHPDGTHHTFAQFGSGTLLGAPTFLSQFTVLNPVNMMNEAEALMSLGAATSLITVAKSALIITPFHIAANRLRETARGALRHGSCGQGIGETVEGAMKFPSAAVRAGDIQSHHVLLEKMSFWRKVKGLEMEELGINLTDTVFDPKAYSIVTMTGMLQDAGLNFMIVEDDWLEGEFDTHDVIFEGAQGVLLDERLGFHPHTTWSKTTPHNARLLLGGREAFSIGVMRSYMTRHGAGPLVTDLGSLGESLYPEEHNGVGEFQGSFRRGAADLVAMQYSARNLTMKKDLDGIAITHMDRLGDEVTFCSGYQRQEGVRWSHMGPMFLQLPLWTQSHPEPCLDHQRLITRIANESGPRYESTNKSDFLMTVEETCRAEIVLMSHGPTHEQKTNYFPTKVGV